MNGTEATVWQIGGGQTSRPYTDVLIKYGVGLIGPGDAGEWTPERGDTKEEGGFVRRFASEMKVGDAIVLRIGNKTICAIGIVASKYKFLNHFDDVNGWDLRHARRIRWCQLPEEHKFEHPVFGANPPRCSRVWNKEIIDFTRRFINSPPTRWQTADLPELPTEEPSLDEVPEPLRDIIATAGDLVSLYWDESNAFGDEAPTEDELVAHVVIPFLRALGWPPELIGVKWRNIDLVLFKHLPRTPKNCKYVIEAKRLGTGFEWAREQARGYVKALGEPRDIIVTDGIRYKMYSCENNFEPIAYANLRNLKQSASELFTRLRSS